MVLMEAYQDTLPERLLLSKDDQLSLSSGTYFIKKMLGKGGFGSVYKVEKDNIHYALKIINLWEMNPSEYDYMRDRCRSEFKAGRIVSKYIVNSHFVGILKGNPYILMDYCSNGNLEDTVHRYKTESDYSNLATNILIGLKHLHDNGIIHRDIKPENILFDENNEIKISDFGISGHLNLRSTRTNFMGRTAEVFGSVIYSSPEQLNHSTYFKYTKPTMDVYSFGATFYYVLSGGIIPFEYTASTNEQITRVKKEKKKGNHRDLKKLNPYLNEKWYELIDRCLEPNPSKRFQNVKAILDFLGTRHISLPKYTNLPKGVSLQILSGNDAGKLIDLKQIINHTNKKLVRIGRDGHNDIVLAEPHTRYISSSHATLENHEKRWILRDGQFVENEGEFKWKNSTNGTMVNDDIYQTRYGVELQNGAIIKIGEINMRFQNII